MANVTLRSKPLRSGMLSLYLDYYPPVIIPKTGKLSRREFLKLKIYEFPENNREMGLLIERNKDHEIFNDTLKEIESIKNSSVLEKGFNDEETLLDSAWDLDPDYNELWNFHLPKLKTLLEETYPQFSIQFLNGQIRVNDFPRKGIDMVVNQWHGRCCGNCNVWRI